MLWFLGLLKLGLKVLGSLLGYLNTKQLLDAGEAKAENKQNEMENQASDKVDKIIKDNSVLDIDTMRDKLRKFRQTK